MLKEFKEFALKGNMIDLAVGVIIGGAFNSLVTSLVDNIIMPVISIFTGKIDFSNLFLSLDGKEYDTLAQAQKAGAATLNYGTFITGLLNFIIMAFVVFLLVKVSRKYTLTQTDAHIVQVNLIRKYPRWNTALPGVL